MSTPLALLFGSGIAWLDIIGLVTGSRCWKRPSLEEEGLSCTVT